MNTLTTGANVLTFFACVLVAGSDGPWFPWINFAAAVVMVLTGATLALSEETLKRR